MSHTAKTGMKSICHDVRKKQPDNKQTNKQTNKKAVGGANYVKKKKRRAPTTNEETGNDRHEKKKERYVHPTSNSGHQNQRPMGPPRIREEETATHQVFACIIHPTHKIPGSLVVLPYLSNHAIRINQLVPHNRSRLNNDRQRIL